MRLFTLISAVLLALCCTVCRAAVLHLEDVILGTIPDQSHQYSDPFTIVSGFFVLDGPFSSNSLVSDYRLTFRDRNGAAFRSVTPPVAPFNWQHQSVMSDIASTRITLHDPSFGMSFLLPTGTGVDVDKGTIPLLTTGSQRAFGWWNNSVGLMDGYGYPVLRGSLMVNDTYGSDDTLPVFTLVPELDIWTIWLAGCVALGWIAKRRIS